MKLVSGRARKAKLFAYKGYLRQLWAGVHSLGLLQYADKKLYRGLA
jgi:hypothetical protein